MKVFCLEVDYPFSPVGNILARRIRGVLPVADPRLFCLKSRII
jgi:hypothetical protein